jgi:hypothetical protein
MCDFPKMLCRFCRFLLPSTIRYPKASITIMLQALDSGDSVWSLIDIQAMLFPTRCFWSGGHYWQLNSVQVKKIVLFSLPGRSRYLVKELKRNYIISTNEHIVNKYRTLCCIHLYCSPNTKVCPVASIKMGISSSLVIPSGKTVTRTNKPL